MNYHFGRSAFDSLIDSLTSNPTDRVLMRAMAQRWGIDVFRPIADLLLTSVDQSYSDALLSATKDDGTRQMSLSTELRPEKNLLLGSLPAGVPRGVERDAAYYLSRYRAPGTLKNRATHVREIIRQCTVYDARPFPMSEGTAIAIVTTLATRGQAAKTIAGMRDTISTMHKLGGESDPTKGVAFARVMRGIERSLGNARKNRKIGLTRLEVAAMRALAIRDGRFDFATMLTVGFEGALRCEELLSLLIRDVRIYGNRWQLLIPHSKGDQTGIGQPVTLEAGDPSLFDPCKDQSAWLRRIGRTSGLVFPVMRGPIPTWERRDARAFARMLKGYAAAIDLDPSTVGTHSLRAGWATDAIDSGKSEAIVAAHLRHKSLEMLNIYYRPRHLPPNFAGSADPGMGS